MNATDSLRAGLAALAAAEQSAPSRVWQPVDHAGPCRPPFLSRTPGCDCTRCCAAAPHEPDCSQPDTPQCTCPDDAGYHRTDCPEHEETSMPDFDQFTAEQIRRCHEATEFDHQCAVCKTLSQEEVLEEPVPGIDY
ncbi:hypothetical protein [Streptomyces leeuwenhoekii]|uniref:Sle1_023 protein n=1 Tax=Streptomyces leeuwenhoekii TaxID=1437453 RepID=A0A0F7VKZ0_STRLW|nr:hypothetical protein [Streptomyces leeuwenhoekii]CQR59190.1 sle1_023 [Streptomyces leeuwenhoekii]